MTQHGQLPVQGYFCGGFYVHGAAAGNAQDAQRGAVVGPQHRLAGQRDAGGQVAKQVAALAADEQPAQVKIIFLLGGLGK